MAALDFLKLTLFQTLIWDSNLGILPATLSNGAAPPPCERIECPYFDVIESGNGYEIRRHNSVVLVVTQVTTSSIVVSFYIPNKYRADPPAAEGLEIQQIGAAVRKFAGLVSDSNLRDEVGALINTISVTSYGDAIYKSHAGDPASNFFVARYNSPFELVDKTN